MGSAVLDASALLALLRSEPGAGESLGHLDGALMSTVNLSEVAGKLVDAGMPDAIAHQALSSLGLTFQDFGEESAHATARLRSMPRGGSLSLGDRACLALGLAEDAVVVTADRAWADLDVPVDVVVIR